MRHIPKSICFRPKKNSNNILYMSPSIILSNNNVKAAMKEEGPLALALIDNGLLSNGSFVKFKIKYNVIIVFDEGLKNWHRFGTK
jgi:hypothetical protein